MRVCIDYCKNCGAEYKWQASGNYWTLDTPKKYNDSEYCPECKKAILEALNNIEQKTKVTFIETNLVNLETLKEWDKLNDEDYAKNNYPCLIKGKKVFPTLTKHDFSDYTYTFEIDGRDEHQDKLFNASYWQNSGEIRHIKVKARVDINGNFIRYER